MGSYSHVRVVGLFAYHFWLVRTKSEATKKIPSKTQPTKRPQTRWKKIIDTEDHWFRGAYKWVELGGHTFGSFGGGAAEAAGGHQAHPVAADDVGHGGTGGKVSVPMAKCFCLNSKFKRNKIIGLIWGGTRPHTAYIAHSTYGIKHSMWNTDYFSKPTRGSNQCFVVDKFTVYIPTAAFPVKKFLSDFCTTDIKPASSLGRAPGRCPRRAR